MAKRKPLLWWNLGAGLIVGAFTLANDVRSLQRIVRGAKCVHSYGFCRQCNADELPERDE